MKQPRITVVGLGLLGGSLLQALRDRKVKATLQGVSATPTIAAALEQKLIDQGWNYSEVDLWKQESDLLILATPIDRIAELLQQIKASSAPFPPGALITDVGSTKGELCALGAELFDGSEGEALFVGGHPMAGSEKRGLGARDGTLFESSLWLLCPDPDSLIAPERLSTLEAVIETVGAHQVKLTPTEHDRTVAWVSHLPQALSSAIATTVARHAPETVAFAGQGFRDMTRLADSPYAVWRSIFGTNTPRLVEALEAAQKVIAEMTQHLRDGEETPVEAIFEEGGALRCSLSPHNKGFSASLIDLVVRVDDRGGALLAIVAPLTREGVDIRDLELLKVREGLGGTFRVAFRSLQEAKRASEILQSEGIEARLPS